MEQTDLEFKLLRVRILWVNGVQLSLHKLLQLFQKPWLPPRPCVEVITSFIHQLTRECMN